MLFYAYLFIVIAIGTRFMQAFSDNPWFHFTALGASLLFFGAHASRKHLMSALALLIGSDLVLTYGVYDMGFMAGDQLVIFAWYAGLMLFAGLLKDRTKPAYLAGAALTSSVSFFLVSNFAVWAFQNMYPKTFAGLMTCYTVGLPYFRNTAASDMIFTFVFFYVPVMVALMKRERAMSAPISPA